jgi:predicted dehydrogenase
MTDFDRRDFLRTAALAGVGLGIDPGAAAGAVAALAEPSPRGRAQTPLFTAPPIDVVRVGFVGVGHQGTAHVREFLKLEGVEIRAICDLVPDKVRRAQALVEAAGHATPAAYAGGREDYRRMCEAEELDLVFTATPWELHAPVLLAAMRAGKHGATEIPLAVTVDECWELVETAEAERRHCVMMENCCYDRTELMILNMVRSGLLGELLHAECGYLHDLRRLKLTDFYEENWRVRHSIERNGDLYPTHGLGPIAQCMNINRGNRFDHLVSMASGARGLNLWAAEHIGADNPAALRDYALGDVVNTLIRTTTGQTMLITHDTNLPRPYSRKVLVQGTRGLVRKYPEQKIHVEGRSPDHRWEDLAAFETEFEHPLWATLSDRSRGAGHGGMDFIEDYRLVHSLRNGEPMDMDVYDGAAWSAVSELSERSIANRSGSIDVPDFTRGAWRGRPPLGIVTA